MRIGIFLTLSLLVVSLAFGQKPIQVTDMSKAMSKGSRPGLSVLIHESEDLKGVTSAFIKAAKGKSKAKTETVGEETQVLNAGIPIITNDSLNVYATFTPSTEGIKLNVWFETVEGFVSSKQEKYYLPAKKFLHDFAAEQYREVVRGQIKEEQKKLKDLDKDLDKLNKDNDKLLSTVSENRVKIENIKNDISVNESDQERVRGQIQAQKKTVDQARNISEDAFKSAEKELKSLEKQLDKLVKEHENYYKQINDLESDIREAERDIIDVENDREVLLGKIKDQKDVIAKLESKLENIQ